MTLRERLSGLAWWAPRALLAGLLIYHFTWGHRSAGPESGPTRAPSGGEATMPAPAPTAAEAAPVAVVMPQPGRAEGGPPEPGPAERDPAEPAGESDPIICEITPGVEAAALPPETPHPAPTIDPAELRALPLPRTAAFTMVTADPRSALQPSYRGSILLDRDGLHVVYPGYTSVVLPGSWAIESIALGLAEPAATGWRLVAEAEPNRYSFGLTSPGWSSGAAVVTVPDTLALRGVTATDLPGRWPVLIHTVRHIVDHMTGESARYRIFVHGDPAMFDLLLQRKPWESGR